VGGGWIKLKAASTEPEQTEHRQSRVMLSFSRLLFSTRPPAQGRASSPEQDRAKKGERVEMSPPASILAQISGSCPLRVRVCWVQLETEAQSPVWSLKVVSRMASICCSLITAVSDGGNVPKYGAGQLSL